MVDESTSEDNVTNKGVNAQSESSPVRVHRCPCETETTSSTVSSAIHSRSLTDIKNEIQTALDLMGPSTPLLTAQNTSSEADNEESVMCLPPKSKQPRTQSDRKRSSNLEEIEKIESIMADVGTPSSHTEYPCCSHHTQFLNSDCVSMTHYMDMNSIQVPTVQPRTSTTRVTTCDNKKKGLMDWLKNRPFQLIMKRSSSNPCELYKINICGQEEDGCPPKRVVFDLVGGIPKPTSSNVATNTIRSPVQKYKSEGFKYKCNDKGSVVTCGCNDMKKQNQKHISCDCDGNTRVDYYYFDHGNAQYFHTTDTPPVMIVEILAEKTEKYTTRFWAEIFATIHIAFSFCISFILQLFKFLMYGVIRPLTVGLMQLASDYFFKPFLTTLFNGVIQPCLIFLYNIATSLRDLCDPISEGFGYFLRELAVLFRAIRLCTYKKNVNDDNCDCNKIGKSDKKRKCAC